MTRHFLRDRNGEEMECREYYGTSYSRYISPDGINWEVVNFDRLDLWFNGKIHFVVWQEV